MMHEEVVESLLDINRRFYRQFANSFAQTRTSPQSGFFKLLDYIPRSSKRFLDVGCGEGRFGRFLFDHDLIERYVGVDFSQELIEIGANTLVGDYYLRELHRRGCLNGLGEFDMIACLATLQHIPGQSNRQILLQEMADHLDADGIIILSNWQFLSSERQKRKLADWSLIDIDPLELEENDYLLTWQRDGFGFRYLAYIDATETEYLARSAALNVSCQFRSDGREGDLNLYTILTAR